MHRSFPSSSSTPSSPLPTRPAVEDLPEGYGAGASAGAPYAEEKEGGEVDGTAEEMRLLVAELRNLGLLQNEAKLLLSLMTSGPSIASDISKVTGIQRTEVYQTLYALQAKGIVFSTFEKPQKYYALAIADVFDALIQIKQNALRKLVKRKAHCQELFDRMMESRASPKTYDRENYQVITGMDAIAAKMARMIPGARNEVLLLVSEKKLHALHHLDVVDRLRSVPKGVRLIVKVMGECKGRDHLYRDVFIDGLAVTRVRGDGDGGGAQDCNFIAGGGSSVPINMLIVDRREAIIIPEEGAAAGDGNEKGRQKIREAGNDKTHTAGNLQPCWTTSHQQYHDDNDNNNNNDNDNDGDVLAGAQRRPKREEYGFYVNTRSLASTFALVFEHLK